MRTRPPGPKVSETTSTHAAATPASEARINTVAASISTAIAPAPRQDGSRLDVGGVYEAHREDPGGS